MGTRPICASTRNCRLTCTDTHPTAHMLRKPGTRVTFACLLLGLRPVADPGWLCVGCGSWCRCGGIVRRSGVSAARTTRSTWMSWTSTARGITLCRHRQPRGGCSSSCDIRRHSRGKHRWRWVGWTVNAPTPTPTENMPIATGGSIYFAADASAGAALTDPRTFEEFETDSQPMETHLSARASRFVGSSPREHTNARCRRHFSSSPVPRTQLRRGATPVRGPGSSCHMDTEGRSRPRGFAMIDDPPPLRRIGAPGSQAFRRGLGKACRANARTAAANRSGCSA